MLYRKDAKDGTLKEVPKSRRMIENLVCVYSDGPYKGKTIDEARKMLQDAQASGSGGGSSRTSAAGVDNPSPLWGGDQDLGLDMALSPGTMNSQQLDQDLAGLALNEGEAAQDLGPDITLTQGSANSQQLQDSAQICH